MSWRTVSHLALMLPPAGVSQDVASPGDRDKGDTMHHLHDALREAYGLPQHATVRTDADPGTDWGISPQVVGDAIAGIDPDRSTVAAEAQHLVYGDRNDGYGHPRRNFTRIAQMWSALMSDKLGDGDYFTPEDVARCMVALKLSRDVHGPKRDNRVDGIGYLIALDRMETGL